MIERRRGQRRKQMRRTKIRNIFDLHLEVERKFFSFWRMNVKKAKVCKREDRRSGIDRRARNAAKYLTD